MFHFLTTLAFTVSFDILLTGGKYVTAVDQLAATIGQHFRDRCLGWQEDQMWKLILTVIALGFTIGPAPAQNQIEKITALNTLSGEYLECTAYFSAAAYCMTGYPAPSVPKIVRDYQQAAKTALSRAISTGRVAGVTNSSADAQSKPVGAAQRQSIKSNCLNIFDLSERYDAFCKQLIQAPDKRVEEVLAGRICTGQYRCFLSANSAPPLRTGY